MGLAVSAIIAMQSSGIFSEIFSVLYFGSISLGLKKEPQKVG